MGDNNAPTLSLSTKQLIWGSALDEEAFFNWLKDIDAVEDRGGPGCLNKNSASLSGTSAGG